jgi:putative DNA primase/helicase
VSRYSKKQVHRDDDGVTHDTTDLRNAERVIERHGENIRYVPTWNKWLVWDGARWGVDDTGGAMRSATDTMRAFLAETFDVAASARGELAEEEAQAIDGDEASKRRIVAAKRKVTASDRLFQWAVSSQNAGKLQSMLTVAKSFAEIATHHDRLDADPWLFNVRNGTIDLRTGLLREHRRDDLITRLASVDFDATATCPTWIAFLARVMAGDTELVEYLQKISGYSMTGSVREQILTFFHGRGKNGKSVCTRTLHDLFGDYACQAPRQLLFQSKGDRHPTELSVLHGRRLAVCPEIDQGQMFDEALVKDLTGDDVIRCRRMREDFWEYAPTHKLLMYGNHKPIVRGDDEGIWRRMRLVPWLVTIPENERDTQLLDKLRAEWAGILAWAVRGCIAWQTQGLREPAAVRGATKAYREESDALGEFFRLRVTFDATATIARRELREAYESHAKDSGAEPVGAKRFASRLREHGVTETTVRRGSSVVDGWRGVRLSSDAERTASSTWWQAKESHHRDVGPNRGQLADIEATGTSGCPNSSVIGEQASTSPYAPTDSQEEFADYLEREGIGGER